MKIRFTQPTGGRVLEEHLLMKKIDAIHGKYKLHQFGTFIPKEILSGIPSVFGEIHHFVGVLLHVDITGVIQFIQNHQKGGLGELYKLSINLNAYLGSIIELLRCYGGDVLSIFSNDFVALWKVNPEESMLEVIHMVVVCANSIQKLLGTYVSDDSEVLKLKTAVSCGNISVGITGNNVMKRFVVLGDAIELLKICTRSANFGEVVVTMSAWPHMLQERYTVQENAVAHYVCIKKINYKSSEFNKKTYFEQKLAKVQAILLKHYMHRDRLKENLTANRQFVSTKLNSEFLNQLPPRLELKEAMKHWGMEDLRSFINEIVYVHISDNQPVEYLTEVREVTVISCKISLESLDYPVVIKVVKAVLDIIVEPISALRGTMYNLQLNESALVVNILLGMILINHQNESSNALRTGYQLQKDFCNITAVREVSIGVTCGLVFCSVLGHPLRREFAIIGRPLIQAQNLARAFLYKVTCEHQVYRTSKLGSLYFKVIQLEEGPDKDFILEYNENFDIVEEISTIRTIVDRVSDYNLIVGIIQNPQIAGYTGICLEGQELVGKSKLLQYTQQIMTEPDAGYLCVFMQLHPRAHYPYACVSDIYEQIFESVTLEFADFSDFCNLPKTLYDFNNEDLTEDVALLKYHILNRFRDIVLFSHRVIVLFIDNLEFIDFQSWEIIEFTFPVGNIRLVLAGAIDECSWKLRLRLESLPELRMKEVLPLKSCYIVELVCSYLDVKAVNANLVQLLERTCKGNPGYIECCILGLINNNTITFNLADRNNIDPTKYYYKDVGELNGEENMYPILDFQVENMNYTDITMDTIYLDLFDSFTPFQQLVVKTAALLGNSFARMLLVAALNYPQQKLLADTMKILFDAKIFDCGSKYMTGDKCIDKIECCRCYFDPEFFTAGHHKLPQYAYCKLIHFRHKQLKRVAYDLIPESKRFELHMLCTDVLEKIQHVCPNCVRNPSNYYAFFGRYAEFMKYCENPIHSDNYFTYAKDCYENVKDTVNLLLPSSENRESSKIEETYVPISRAIEPEVCRCVEMLYSVYQDIIMHASCAQELGKVIFYKLKVGVIQLFKLDIEGAMETFTSIRECCLSDANVNAKGITANFRKYHIGKSSTALAISYLTLKNIPAAKNSIILALRQYNIPILAFNYKQFRRLLRRKHLHLPTLRPYQTTKQYFTWDMGMTMFICAKIFAAEDSTRLARDCLKFSIALTKAANNNIVILMEHYCDVVDIFRKAGDGETCERLQLYLIREIQTRYAGNNTFFLHRFLDFLAVVLYMHVERGNLMKAVRLGYRLIHVTDTIKIVEIKPHSLMAVCELSLYTYSFRDFIDIFNMLSRRLAQSGDFVTYFQICMQCYILTGFHIVKMSEVMKSVKRYFEDKKHLRKADVLLKLLINVHLLRQQQYREALKWDVTFNYKNAKIGNLKTMKIMLSQMEVYLMRMVFVLRHFDTIEVHKLKKDIAKLFEFLKLACNHNLMYKPAYLCLLAWYHMLMKKKFRARRGLQNAYKLAKKHNNLYYMAFAVRLKSHWNGGFFYEYTKRPQVSIDKAPSYSYLQFTQFLHPYFIE